MVPYTKQHSICYFNGTCYGFKDIRPNARRVGILVPVTVKFFFSSASLLIFLFASGLWRTHARVCPDGDNAFVTLLSISLTYKLDDEGLQLDKIVLIQRRPMRTTNRLKTRVSPIIILCFCYFANNIT